MSITIKDKTYDTMKEACLRLDISRQTMLRYLADSYFSAPKSHRQGREKLVRYFDAEWYALNEPKLRRGPSTDTESPTSDADGASQATISDSTK